MSVTLRQTRSVEPEKSKTRTLGAVAKAVWDFPVNSILTKSVARFGSARVGVRAATLGLATGFVALEVGGIATALHANDGVANAMAYTLGAASVVYVAGFLLTGQAFARNFVRQVRGVRTDSSLSGD
jgi:hypothetical protein